MANVDNPHGFRPMGRNLYGGPTRSALTHKLAAYGTALFIGDALALVSTGTKKWPCVSAAITPGTTPVFGVCMEYKAATLATDQMVVEALGEVFECQENNAGSAVDGGSAGVVAANVNNNANIILGAGSATTQKSGHELNQATLATTATLDVHILDLLDVPDNAFGSFARVEVVFNNANRANQAAGA